MSVTKQLLELFRVDKQLRGLRSRLEASERFLTQQSAFLSEMEKQKVALEAQLKQLKAATANDEGEAARLEAKLAGYRDQMNSAKTAKEYNAFLTELNTFKEQKNQYETRSLESMGKTDEIEKTLSAIVAQHSERVKIVATAKTERDTRESEIKDRVAELQTQRDALAAAVPARERNELEMLIKSRGDDAMVPLEIIDRRNHECNCSACMMAVTMEAVSAILSGKLVHCPSCRCMLYAEEETFAAEPAKPAKAPKEPKAPRVSKAKKPKTASESDAEVANT